MRINWRGTEVEKKMLAATKKGINRIMSRCVIHAKKNHPGWKNRTGLAEGSVQIIQYAELWGNIVRGRWGSKSVHYVIWLELKHGSFMRSAADAHYKNLWSEIAQEFDRGFA